MGSPQLGNNVRSAIKSRTMLVMPSFADRVMQQPLDQYYAPVECRNRMSKSGHFTHRRLEQRERVRQNDPVAKVINPPNIITAVIVFGPGQDDAQPTNKLPSPTNATAPQRRRCRTKVLVGRMMKSKATGKQITNASAAMRDMNISFSNGILRHSLCSGRQLP